MADEKSAALDSVVARIESGQTALPASTRSAAAAWRAAETALNDWAAVQKCARAKVDWRAVLFPILDADEAAERAWKDHEAQRSDESARVLETRLSDAARLRLDTIERHGGNTGKQP